MCKQSSKRNYFPQLSLLALSIAAANSAFAVECNKETVIFNGQKNGILTNCNMVNPEIIHNSHSMVNVINSQNITLENNNFSFSGQGEGSGHYGNFYGINLENSTAKIKNTNVEINNVDDYVAALNMSNSNAVLVGGNFKVNNHDQARWSSLFRLNNSTLSIKDLTLLGDGKDSFEIINLENSTVSLDNVTLNTQGTSFIFAEMASKDKGTLDTISVNNSVLVAGKDSEVIGGWWGHSEKYQNVKLTLNNSTVKGETLAFVEDYVDDIGDVENYVDVIANNSILGGTPVVENINSNHSAMNVTLNNSEWSFSMLKDMEEEDGSKSDIKPSVSNLALTNSNVNLLKADDFYTFTIGNLSGNGNFSLNTDLANQKSDQIVITGKADGSHTLVVHNSDNEPQSANGKVTLVKTAGNGDATFRLKDRDYVDAGAYRYRLNKESNDWVLSNREAEAVKRTDSPKPAEPVKPTESEKLADTTKPAETVKPTEVAKPTEPVKPVESEKLVDTTKPAEAVKPAEVVTPIVPVNPSIPNDRVVLSEKSNALVSLRQAQLLQLEQGLVGIHQRLDELKQGTSGHIWVRNLNSKSKFDSVATASNSYSSGFEQRYHGVQLGADQAVSDNLRLGGFVGRERSNVDFKGDYGSGKLTGNSVGLYATYHNASGLYLDNIAKFSRLKSTSNATGSRHYNAYTLSSEIGKIYQLANQWSITPNAQIAWSTVSGKNDEERLSSVYSRVGARVAKTVELGNWALQPYAELNGISTHNNHSKVNVNQHRFDVASSKGRIATALGLNAVTGKHRFGLEIQNSNGKRVDQPFAIQANYRYQW